MNQKFAGALNEIMQADEQEIAGLRAENERLTAALEMIASMSGWPASGQQAHAQTDLDHLTRYTAIRQYARAALKGGKP